MAPSHVDGLCSKCGLSGHHAIYCHPAGRKKSTRSCHFRNSKAKPPTVALGHAKHVDVTKARKDPTIVMGTLLVNSVPASVLFDSGASHSFVSEAFALKKELPLERMYSPLVVSSPGSKWETSMIAHNNRIKIGGLVFSHGPQGNY